MRVILVDNGLARERGRADEANARTCVAFSPLFATVTPVLFSYTVIRQLVMRAPAHGPSELDELRVTRLNLELTNFASSGIVGDVVMMRGGSVCRPGISI